jgi:hypothetical protein
LQVSLEMAAMGRERGIERQRDELRFEPHDSSSGPSSKANSVQRATRGPPHRRNVQRAPSTRGPSSKARLLPALPFPRPFGCQL